MRSNSNFFGKALADYLAGPPEIAQTDFANKISMTKPALSRIIGGHLGVNYESLDKILGGVPAKLRPRLVACYFRDHASPLALGYLHSTADAEDWERLELDKMTSHGRNALNAILRSSQVQAFEKFTLNFAEIMGLKFAG